MLLHVITIATCAVFFRSQGTFRDIRRFVWSTSLLAKNSLAPKCCNWFFQSVKPFRLLTRIEKNLTWFVPMCSPLRQPGNASSPLWTRTWRSQSVPWWARWTKSQRGVTHGFPKWAWWTRQRRHLWPVQAWARWGWILQLPNDVLWRWTKWGVRFRGISLSRRWWDGPWCWKYQGPSFSILLHSHPVLENTALSIFNRYKNRTSKKKRKYNNSRRKADAEARAANKKDKDGVKQTRVPRNDPVPLQYICKLMFLFVVPWFLLPPQYLQACRDISQF